MEEHAGWLVNALYVILIFLGSTTIYLLKGYHKRIEKGFVDLGSQIQQVNRRVGGLAQRVAHVEGKLGISAAGIDTDIDQDCDQP